MYKRITPSVFRPPTKEEVKNRKIQSMLETLKKSLIMTPIIVLLVILNYQIPKFILESVLGIKYGTSILYDLVMWFFIIFGNIFSVRKVITF